METDSGQVISVSQSAQDTAEVGAETTSADGKQNSDHSEAKTEESNKIIKTSTENENLEPKENGEKAKENGEVAKENLVSNEKDGGHGEESHQNGSTEEVASKENEGEEEAVDVQTTGADGNMSNALDHDETDPQPPQPPSSEAPKSNVGGQEIENEHIAENAMINPDIHETTAHGENEGDTDKLETRESETELETEETAKLISDETMKIEFNPETPDDQSDGLSKITEVIETTIPEGNTADEENNSENQTDLNSVLTESTDENIQDEVTNVEPLAEVQDAIDVEQVQVKIALNTNESVECVLENVAVVDQVTNVTEPDPMEEDLESFAPAPVPVKEEEAQNQENQEQILVDDEEMVITQITHLDELDPNVSVETNGDGQTKVIITSAAPVTKEEGAVDIDQFTDTEDLVIYALDTISPFDAKFISQHMVDRDEHQIERRLVDHNFRKKSFNFQKLPLMMFEMVFVSESNERMPSLMILTQKQLLQLSPKGSWCQYGPGIETIEMHYTNKTRFGIDTSALCEFIITNIPNMHMPYLR